MALLPVLATAFLAGLLGGGHCFGMCAGIAGSFGAIDLMNAARSLEHRLIAGEHNVTIEMEAFVTQLATFVDAISEYQRRDQQETSTG